MTNFTVEKIDQCQGKPIVPYYVIKREPGTNKDGWYGCGMDFRTDDPKAAEWLRDKLNA